MLWLDMGIGKTIVTLTSIAHLINCGYLTSVLIVAPIRVCRLVWRQEALKWDHTSHLTFNMVMGNKDQRTRALLRKADIYLINYENLKWLSETLHTYFISKKKPVPFNGIVWDEISKMKNSSTNRVKSFMKVYPQFDWKTGLTGTPASNGYMDLHGQYLVIDGGMRLGTSKTAFRNRFYTPSGPYKWKPYDTTESEIERLIGDITLQMSAEDYNPLPDMLVNDVIVDLEPSVREKYEQLEREMFFHLDSGDGVEVFNAAALTNKSLQFSNGAVYPIPGMPMWQPVHDEKLNALEDIIEEANGQQVLCSYAYRSDAERIMTRFKHLDPINLTDCKSEAALRGAMARWKDGDCPLMIGHPACLSPDTQVFTERNGWTRIVEVQTDDHVFDGIEFVSHSGCMYSGYKEVIDVFGIMMTPDHKLLIDDVWVEGRHVANKEHVKRKAIYRGEIPNTSRGGVSELWRSAKNAASKLCETQQKEQESLLSLHGRELSQYEQNSNLSHMARNDQPMRQPEITERCEKLWRTWNRSLSRMATILKFLQRHEGGIFGRLDNRTGGCERSLLQGKLQMVVHVRSAVEQKEQSHHRVSRGENTSCGTGAEKWIQQDDADYATQPWNDWGRSSAELRSFSLRQESRPKERRAKTKAPVYDLVDCGPRHQFVIRNNQGEMFISHNSMGHGVDGLQDNGHIIVWFGLNWSLDLYEQFNARVRRQGQGVPVICHRIMTKDTLDFAQAEALDEKSSTQKALRAAIKRYREKKSV